MPGFRGPGRGPHRMPPMRRRHSASPIALIVCCYLVNGDPILIPYNMFITNRKLLDDYCSELFPILFRLEKELILNNRNMYQKRVFGFLSERYFTAYVRKMGLKAYICPVHIPETEYPIRKMKYFCGRKFNQFYFEYMTKRNKRDERHKRI